MVWIRISMEDGKPTMSDSPKSQPVDPKQADKVQEDLTGRDQLVSNVIWSWAAYLVFIVAGFVLPRMIDRRLGQELLGVWDFAWSIVSYFGLVQGGVGSSVNRYVAKYRTSGDISGVNRVASTALCIQNVAAMLVLVLTTGVSLMLPHLFGARLRENIRDAQWIVFLLGISIAIQISFAAFSGVLTGCHRWKLHNTIKSGWHAVTFTGMILAILWGGGLPSLGVITVGGIVLEAITHAIFAYRVCEGLRLRLSLVRWRTGRDLFVFGGKTLIPYVSNLLLTQSIAILIVIYLGPAALALYARPRSLVRHMQTLVNKMAFVLTPATSSLQSAKDWKGIQDLLIQSVRYSLYMVMPMILVLVVFGSLILLLWMGARYANGLIPAILAIGYLATMVQMPIFSILTGLNMHGRAGIAQLVASLCSVGLTVLVLGPLEWGLIGTAVAVVLPLTIVNLFYLPLLMCRKVDLDVRRYVLSVAIGPAKHVLPFAICLVAARLVFHTKPLIGLVCGGVGSIMLLMTYWKYVLPENMRVKIMNTIWIFCASYLRQTGVFLFRGLGLIRLFQFLHRNHIVIASAHGVMDDRDDSQWKPLWQRLSSEKLEKHLSVLSKRYRFISLMDAVEMIQGRKPIKPYTIVLTFDDGYRNHITRALPILSRYNAPVTFFVPTGFLDNPRPFWFDRLDYTLQQVQANSLEVKVGSFTISVDRSNRKSLRRSYKRLRYMAKAQKVSDLEFLQGMQRLAEQLESESGRALADIQQDDNWSAIMTWEQVKQIGTDGVTIGSHTVDHIRLGQVDNENARDQLTKSKRDIEDRIGKPCICLAYPNGSYTNEMMDLAKECGYNCCVTTDEGLNRVGDDVFRLRRINLSDSMSSTNLLINICGLRRTLSTIRVHLRSLCSWLPETSDLQIRE
ncbi:polysaccharide deacetylase family protein [Planctomycetota bacterium]